MFLYYYATVEVVTPPAMHVVTVLLAGGQIGFPLPLEQATAIDDYPLVGLYFWYCQLYYSYMVLLVG
jgi:hypothetical protein